MYGSVFYKILGKEMFLSSLTNAIDAKGRISVPAEFRSVALKQGFEGVICWPSFEGGFLEGGGLFFLQNIQSLIESMDPYDEARMAFERTIFGSARKLSFDSNGRVSIPRELLEYAGIKNRASFVGLGSRFEIWDPEAYVQRAKQDRILAKEMKSKLQIGFKTGGNI